jgi:hypothetical protein
MIPTVNLPRDGAKFHCTFTRDGARCNKVTTKGVAFIAYEVALVAAKEKGLSNVTFMRALCPDHIVEVSEIAGYGS